MKHILLLITLSLSFAMVAQSKLERADRYFTEFKFDKAIPLYKDLASEKKKPSLHVIQHLADSYFNMNHYTRCHKLVQ